VDDVPQPHRSASRSAAALRNVGVAVYADMEYGYRDGALVARESFALFAAALRDYVDRLVLVGRVDPSSGSALPHRLRRDVELIELPYYSALSNPMQVARGATRSLARFWGVLDEVDAVWLLGPHPLAIAFAVLAAARRRRVVLGVRQDMRAYVRHRHPGHRALHVSAGVLELAWRALARVYPTVVVGDDLARRYRRSARLVSICVTLVDPRDLVGSDDAPARQYDGELRVLSVGRLDREKNPLLLADVLALLRAHGGQWRLLVCGDGTERGALAARLRALALADHAELRGAVPVEDVRSMWASSHVFLHTSWTEGVPQVLFEAFAAGIPVVATNVGGVAAAAGGAALLVPPGNAAAAAVAVARIGADAQLRRRLIAAGLERVRGRTTAAECRRVAAVLRPTADRDGGPMVGEPDVARLPGLRRRSVARPRTRIGPARR
jgi:glycosyltransferase involved in cell wall biosynthesis